MDDILGMKKALPKVSATRKQLLGVEEQAKRSQSIKVREFGVEILMCAKRHDVCSCARTGIHVTIQLRTCRTIWHTIVHVWHLRNAR
jgi:hypothetical protein